MHCYNNCYCQLTKVFFGWHQSLHLYPTVQLPWSNWAAIWSICIQTWFLCVAVFINLIWLQSMCQLSPLWSNCSRRIAKWSAFFYKFSLLDTQLKLWGRENNILKFLSSSYETKWYSHVLVCIGVTSYHKGFQHCVDKSRLANKSPINNDISNLVDEDYHFAINKKICKLIKPIFNNIVRLEQNFTTLDQVCAKLINLYTTVKDVDGTLNCSSFKTHIIKTIKKRASKFDHLFYFVALFLNLKYQAVAISRKNTYNDIQKDIATLAKW